MSRKIYATVTVSMIVRTDDDTKVSDIFDEMDYSFSDTTGKATIEDTNIEDVEITDSK